MKIRQCDSTSNRVSFLVHVLANRPDIDSGTPPASAATFITKQFTLNRA